MTGANSDHVYDLYRSPNGATGSKDWAIAVVGNALHVRFGPTGKPMQLREINSTDGRSLVERDARIKAKSDEGYTFVGNARCVKGRMEVIDPERYTQKVHSAIVWAVLKPIPRQEFVSALETIAMTLKPVCKTVVPTVIPGMGLALINGNVRWDIGLQVNGGIVNKRGGGSISPQLGIYPIVVLMKACALFPEQFKLAYASGDDVQLQLRKDNDVLGEASPWVLNTPGVTFNQVKEAVLALGLFPGHLSVITNDNGARDHWF